MLLRAEHSPLYTLQYVWEWENLPSWVATHFVRHHVGFIPFVQSQRNDRQKDYDRRTAPQDSPVLMRCQANAQSIINISKLRLCQQAAPETRYAWQLFLQELSKQDCILPSYCVPKCVYRNGICGEPRRCKQGVPKEILRKYRMITAEGWDIIESGTTL